MMSLTIDRRLAGWYSLATEFSSTSSPQVLLGRDFSKICKTRFLVLKMLIFERSANTYESLGVQFFRTITGIQLGPDASQESRSVTIF